jgi:farnesyl-diphosphate farnesyltransferase
LFILDGPNEKDRELLVQFDVVINEFLQLKPEYQSVIANITKLMGDGMADYATGEHRENTSVATIADFDLYCHYVAGLVGYGLSDLFAASGLESEEIAKDKDLSNTMGLFLQKTNIIRDYREDLDDGRQFWPREIWGLYVDKFSDLTKPENKEKVSNSFFFNYVI